MSALIGGRLNWYIARVFTRNTLFIYLFFLVLILSVDSLELSRSLGGQVEAGFADVFLISLLRVPNFAQRVLPFAVLFSAVLSLILLSRRLELVVARASGVSVWQFMRPVFVCAVLFGLGVSLLYQPLALVSDRYSQALEADTFGRLKGNYANKSNNFWLRAGQVQGDVIVRAAIAQDSGRDLAAVSFYTFDPEGRPTFRIDAERALFEERSDGINVYILRNAVVTRPGQASETRAEMEVPVNVSPLELQLSATTPDRVPFWSLGSHAERARLSGHNPLPFIAERHSHLALPLLFVAMALIAATVSLRFARFGLSGRLVMAGLSAGFVVYVISEIVLTLGSNGLVSPFLAAWSPASVAVLLGITILLHQEDG